MPSSPLMRLDGAEELVKALRGLTEDVDKRIAGQGILAGLRVVANEMRKQVGAQKAASPHLRRAAKRVIGAAHRARRGRRGEKVGKAGFAVGKSRKKFKEKRSGKNMTTGGKPKGVGLGPANIHWFVLGTTERSTGSVRRRRSRAQTGNSIRRTGKLQPVFSGLAARALRASGHQAIRAAADRIAAQVAKAAQKRAYKAKAA